MFNLNIDTLYASSPEGNIYKFGLPLGNTITVDGREVAIEIQYNEEYGLSLLLDGKMLPIDIKKLKHNRYMITLNGVSYDYTIDTPFAIQRQKMLENKRKMSGTNVVTIQAPMPGKIIDIAVSNGSQVRSGDTLLLLEAMKMENEILSPIDGKVTVVAVKPNDNVLKDNILVQIVAEKYGD